MIIICIMIWSYLVISVHCEEKRTLFEEIWVFIIAPAMIIGCLMISMESIADSLKKQNKQKEE